MIKNKIAAGKISILMLDLGARIDESVRIIQETCDEEDFKIYRLAAGNVMAEILLKVLNPLYKDHPSLKPPELD